MSQFKSDAAPSSQLKQIFQTGSLFAATLSHLNQRSTLALFDELTHEIDEHCRKSKRRSGILLVLLVLLLIPLFFGVGLLTARRSSALTVSATPPPSCCQPLASAAAPAAVASAAPPAASLQAASLQAAMAPDRENEVALSPARAELARYKLSPGSM